MLSHETDTAIQDGAAVVAESKTQPSMLSRKAVLASLNISQWSARALDKQVTKETNVQHGAKADAGRYNKLLIDAKNLEPIQKIVSGARTAHLTLTMPWSDAGPRILPSQLVMKYMDTMRTARTEFDAAADQFAQDYPRLVQERISALGSMFKDSDYPSAREIRKRFGFAVEVLPIAEASDFRVDVGESAAADLLQQVRETMGRSMQSAMGDATARIIETVGRMAERLKAYKPAQGEEKAQGVFRDSLVENVRELAGLLPAFNLTGDARLSTVAERIRVQLCEFDAAQLRDSDNARAKVAAAADSILADVSAFMA
jgi:hypothetical protein